MEKLNFKYIKLCDSALMDHCIDMVYMLTTTNTRHSENIKKQLSFLKTNKIISNIVIVTNNTDIKVEKKILDKSPIASDIIYSYMSIFSFSVKRKEKNIMILEDDVKFKIKIDEIKEIINFIKNLGDKMFVYNFGSPGHFSLPLYYNTKHYISIMYGFSHCTVYSNKYKHKYISDYYNKRIKYYHDFHWNDLFTLKYMYHKPVAYQIFYMTKNRKEWNDIFSYTLIKIFGLDKESCDYTYIFNFFKFATYLLVVIVISLFILIFYIIKNLINLFKVI